MTTITAVDLYNVTQCAHRVYLDAHGDPAQKSEVSRFVQLLWEKGLQTERDYIARLGYDAVDDLQALSIRDAADQTLALMSGGARLIYQGVLISGDQVERPDLLTVTVSGSRSASAGWTLPTTPRGSSSWALRSSRSSRRGSPPWTTSPS